MTNTPNLKTIERRAFREIFVDGLVDIGLGIWFIVMAMLVISDYAAFGGLVLVLMIPIWERVRQQVTVPRVGVVRYRPAARNVRIGVVIAILSLTMVGGILLAVTRGNGPHGMEDFLSAHPHLLFGSVLAFLIICLGAIFRIPRLIAYAGVLLALLAAGDLLGVPFPYSMMLAGGLIAVSGAVILTRFLRENPVVAHENAG